MGELNMCRQLGIKPNFTQVAKKYGLHRQTVAKYWRQGEEIEDRRRDKGSSFDDFRNVIERKAALPGVTKKAIHEFLLDRYPEAGLPKYGAFTKYCRERGIGCASASEPDAHPRFEAPPGRQMQFDWKEDMGMVDVNGEAFGFNVFSAVLGFSRAHRFVYSRTRTDAACKLASLAAVLCHSLVLSCSFLFLLEKREKKPFVVPFLLTAGCIAYYAKLVHIIRLDRPDFL